MLSKSTLAAQTDVIELTPFRAEGRLMAVGWKASTREVTIWKLSGTGLAPINVGVWFTANPAVGRPKISVAESYGRVFFAHDFADTGLRASTIWFDASDLVTPLKPLTGDLDRSGTAHDIKFRGVRTYLSYLVGWGYGTNADPDRPEIARVSLPGDPLTFDPDHLFYAGQRSSPIVGGHPAGHTFLLLKENESYEITGYDRLTFSIRPADPLYGLVANRLGVTVGGTLYFWSLEGPRATDGGVSSDLAVPLDLGGPAPADLAAEGDVTAGFAYYLPIDRCVIWAFPNDGTNRTREYCLSLRDPANPRWSYWERAQRILCAGTVFSTVVNIPPPGLPDFDAATGVTYLSARYNWTNDATVIGDETVEIWAKPTAGVWQLRGTVPINGAGLTQYFDEPLELASSTTYSVAYRYKRGASYNAGAEDAYDPTGWPAASQGSFTTAAEPPFPAANFRMTACGLDSSYVTRTVTWDNPGTVHAWEILQSSGPVRGSVPGIGSAAVIQSGSTHPASVNISVARSIHSPWTYYRWFFRFVGDTTVYELDAGATIGDNSSCSTVVPPDTPSAPSLNAVFSGHKMQASWSIGAGGWDVEIVWSSAPTSAGPFVEVSRQLFAIDPGFAQITGVVSGDTYRAHLHYVNAIGQGPESADSNDEVAL